MAAPDPGEESGALRTGLGLAAGALLLCLILVTCVDVAGRYFLGAPLRGAFELTEILLAALVFAALPLTTDRREHVEVDLLSLRLGPAPRRLLAGFAGLVSAAVLLTLAWRLGLQALSALEDGATTNALAIPLAPVGALAALSCLASAGLAALRGLRPPRTP